MKPLSTFTPPPHPLARLYTLAVALAALMAGGNAGNGAGGLGRAFGWQDRAKCLSPRSFGKYSYSLAHQKWLYYRGRK